MLVIDLFLGEVTRPHDDLEVAVLRNDLPVVRSHLERISGFEVYAVGDGEVRRLPAGEELPPDRHQTWVLDVEAQRWRIDVMSDPGDADTWVFRRDHAVRAPRKDMVRRTADGIPYLAPAGALLYKAKACRPKDVADLESCLPQLEAGDRAWLAEALAAVHPSHEWLARFDG